MKTVAVIPCYNEAESIATIVKVAKEYVDVVIVVDDNSTDNTANIASMFGAIITKPPKGHGAGAATGQGFNTAQISEADIIVTLDGDGQHDPNEIPVVLKPMLDNEADLVIGSRFHYPSWLQAASMMPYYRKCGNELISWLYNIGHKQQIVDTQSCYRAYSKKLLDDIKVTEAGFAFSVETLIKARHKGYRIVEIPVKCIYHKDYWRNSSMNPIKHGFTVLLGIVKWRLRLDLTKWIKYALYITFRTIARKLVGHGLGNIKPLARIYKTLCGLLIPESIRIVDVNGYKMKIDHKHIDGVTQQIVFEGGYERNTTEFFKRLIKESDNVIDVGANIGYFTLLASKLVGDNGKVWAFEPVPTNIANLERNIALNEFANITVVPNAASDINSKATMFLDEMESGSHSLIRKPLYCSETLEVDTVRIDDILNGNKINFIKCDAEGHDMKVLMGADKAIQDNKDIKLIVEFLLPGVESPSYTPEELWQLIEEHFGFKYIYIIDEIEHTVQRGNLELAKKCYSRYKLSINLLCSREEIEL